MNSTVVTRTLGQDPFGKGHCSLPRLFLFPVPGGVPTAMPTVHSSCACAGIRLASCLATVAVCSHSSLVAVTMTVSGAHFAHLLSVVLLIANHKVSCGR